VVIAVSSASFADWIKFADGMSVKLACSREALEAWWSAVSARNEPRSADVLRGFQVGRGRRKRCIDRVWMYAPVHIPPGCVSHAGPPSGGFLFLKPASF
jgi:Protein of unknown function (DUF2478)